LPLRGNYSNSGGLSAAHCLHIRILYIRRCQPYCFILSGKNRNFFLFFCILLKLYRSLTQNCTSRPRKTSVRPYQVSVHACAEVRYACTKSTSRKSAPRTTALRLHSPEGGPAARSPQSVPASPPRQVAVADRLHSPEGGYRRSLTSIRPRLASTAGGLN
jgi:hypothetical protein